MTRARYRFRRHDIRPDLEPDAEPITYRVRCSVCGELRPLRETTEDSTAWIVDHVKSQPDHMTYRETIARSYRAVPGDWL